MCFAVQLARGWMASGVDYVLFFTLLTRVGQKSRGENSKFLYLKKKCFSGNFPIHFTAED